MMGLAVFIFGAIVGSFLNVCIHRMPLEKSIVFPGSRCAQCHKPIQWHDNIPILSFIILRGHCRSCGATYSVRYFLVELLTAISWVILWNWFGFSGQFLAGIVLFSLLIAVMVTDLETGLIPDLLSYPGIFAGLVLSTLIPSLQGKNFWYEGFLHSLYGVLAGGGILWLLAIVGTYIYKKDAMGGGDIKLLAMLGAFLGATKAILVFFFSPFIALPFALFVKYAKKEETIPYGPYIAVAGGWCFLYGSAWLRNFYGFHSF